MRNLRFWLNLIIVIVFLFVMYPLQMSIVSLFLVLLYFVCRRLARVNDEQILKNNKRMRREEALRLARIYLAPYTNIWGNLKLSNKFCSLKLCADGTTILGNELGEPYRQFKIIATKVHDWQDLWDMFCKSFHYNTTYDGLVKNCALFRTTIRETVKETTVSIDPSVKQAEVKPEDKVDVNNASEVELTSLPGISIVMSKKLIKKREEIGGFKSVDDVFLFLHLREHMQEQLKDRIYVNPMKGYTRIERSAERNIDL